ncbi:MAG TPA: PBP1A family penicillin-binding protein [Beijerinckiaceae bacterium]
MSFSPAPSLWTRLKRAALGFDSWVNASLYDGGRRAADAWEGYSERVAKLRVRGAKRAVLDLTSEAVTLGAGGAVVLLALAIPAFRETSENWLKKQDLAVTFLDRYGQEVGRRGIRHDDSVRLEEFPDYLIKAALATEDRRFFEHWGIDPVGTFRALTVNARGGGTVQGGSSLTQQLAKNLFLSNERTLERKIKEAFLAVWLEFHLSKNEILKLYLDRAYMGGGAFGAAAAAEYYFGKSVKDISLAEAAMLAGLFKAPTKYAPHVNLPAARARANDVLTNMVEAGFLTEGQIQTARRNPASPVDRKRETTPDYYLDWAFEEVKKLADAGKLGNDRVLVVKTPLDISMQRKGEETLETLLRQQGRQYDADQGALVVMDVDGAVRVMVGGRDYGQSQFNRATDALRQPGSSFKPFVYAAALTAIPRYRPNSVVVDSPVCIGNWCPQNYNRSYSGSMPMTTALAKSINSIPVKFSVEIGRAVSRDQNSAKAGRAVIIDTARRMGLTHPLADSTSLPIGAAEVTVLDMTAAYAVFANGGRKATPYAAYEVRNSNGDVIYRRDRDVQPPQVLSTRVVADMNQMMVKVVEEGTGRRALLDGVRVAGKTGTTNAYRDAWFVGYTGNMAAAVWFGNDDHTSTNNMTGGTLPATAWHDVMAFAHQNLEIKPIPGLEAEKPSAVAANKPAAPQPGEAPAVAPGALSRRSFEVIDGFGELLRKAERPPAAFSSLPARAADNSGLRSVGGRIATP